MPNEPKPPPHLHWYEVVETKNIRQGDLFRALTVYWLPQDLPSPGDAVHEGEKLKIPAERARGDWIVLTASCDLDQNRCSHVLLAQVLPVNKDTLKAHDKEEKEYDEIREALRRGYYPSRFLLANYPDIKPPLPTSFAEFRRHVLMPMDYIRRACEGQRLRLRPPLREKFGNWVGSCLSAVGPEDEALIPPFRKNLFPAQILRAADNE